MKVADIIQWIAIIVFLTLALTMGYGSQGIMASEMYLETTDGHVYTAENVYVFYENLRDESVDEISVKCSSSEKHPGTIYVGDTPLDATELEFDDVKIILLVYEAEEL